jgi:hypothetical protein
MMTVEVSCVLARAAREYARPTILCNGFESEGYDWLSDVEAA